MAALHRRLPPEPLAGLQRRHLHTRVNIRVIIRAIIRAIIRVIILIMCASLLILLPSIQVIDSPFEPCPGQ